MLPHPFTDPVTYTGSLRTIRCCARRAIQKSSDGLDCADPKLQRNWLILGGVGLLAVFPLAFAIIIPAVYFLGVLVAVVVFSIWAPLRNSDVGQRWFGWPNTLILAPILVITAAIAAWLWWELRRGQVAPFIGAMGLFLMSYLGIAISLWPMRVSWHSRSGKLPHPRVRKPSCWSALCFCCR